MRRAGLTIALLLAGCGGAPSGGAGAPRAGAWGVALHAGSSERLFGLTEEALPELASIWPALSARAATEVTETLRVEGERATHCVHVVVVGDLALEARQEWRRGAEEAAYACEAGERELFCEAESTSVRVWADGGEPGEDAQALEALAAEMGVPEEPSSTAIACVEGLSPARLATIDERLHRAALLEPWQPLHERLGARRFVELRWSRAAARGDELHVRYRADEEAFELAEQWARETGLAGADGVWQRVGSPLSFALELRDSDEPELELALTREP